MNIFLTLGIFFTFMFCIYAIQSINYYIAMLIKDDRTKKEKINPYAPFICAIISSICYGMAF